MKKVLIIILVVLLVILVAMGGYLWYLKSHIFVEDAVYAKSSETLDLRGQDISIEHYLTVQDQLPACEILWDVPFQGGALSSDTTALTITTLSGEDIAMLDYFPNLRKVDAAGCKDYAQLAELCRQYPDLEVAYQVDLGGISVDPDVTELTLLPGDFDYTTLMQNLYYLPQVEKVLFSKAALTVDEIDNLHMEYSNIAVDYTVEILGKEYTSEVTELDLSAMTSADVEAVSAVLPMLVNVTNVELMDASGKSSLTLEDVKALKTAVPNATIHYSFEFLGKTLSTTDETVKYSGSRIGAVDADQLRLVLDVMENCEKFTLEYWSYGSLNSETLAQIREEYRDKTKLVWRVFFGEGGSTLTDAEVLRIVYGLGDDNSKDLMYCEDVRFMDLGHDEFLDAAPFVAYMTKLEAVILSGAPIKDLTPFASCPNLKFLELANCMYITDLSPLAACTQLEMLNLSYSGITDLSALDEINLTHLTAIHNKISKEDEERFVELHPDCWTVWENGDQPYGKGWRYDEDGLTFLPWYAKLVEVFRYPDAPNNVGWYLD